MSKTRSLHHIVFATKMRKPAISEENKRDLFAYILGILRNKKCHLLRINGVVNHIHMLVDIHPSIAMADLVRDVKQYSSAWLKDNRKFTGFDSWAKGYYAVSLGVDNIESCKAYIINQEKHHLGQDFTSEIKNMAEYNGLDWHPDDML